MSYTDRETLIQTLEGIRGSRVLSYVLADTQSLPPGIPGFSTQLGTEPLLFFVDHLRAIGKVEKLDLFLYTRGGNTDSVWPLISMLREYSDHLTIIVPFRAHSGGTLICLGSDEVILSEIAELSPIDPTTGNQFNPADPQNPQNRFGISVEDVAAYLELARERVGISQEPYWLEVLKQLTEHVHPLALGNVQRVYMQIRRLARELLCLHLDPETESKRIEEIGKKLTEEFYSHVHAITRREAIPLLGDWARPPTREEAEAIDSLFGSYSETLNLRERFSLPSYMGGELARDLQVIGAFLESTEHSDIWLTELRVGQRPNLPPGVQVQVPPGQPIPLEPWIGRSYDFDVRSMGWQRNEEGL